MDTHVLDVLEISSFIRVNYPGLELTLPDAPRQLARSPRIRSLADARLIYAYAQSLNNQHAGIHNGRDTRYI
jgi:hypothetical protein